MYPKLLHQSILFEDEYRPAVVVVIFKMLWLSIVVCDQLRQTQTDLGRWPFWPILCVATFVHNSCQCVRVCPGRSNKTTELPTSQSILPSESENGNIGNKFVIDSYKEPNVFLATEQNSQWTKVPNPWNSPGLKNGGANVLGLSKGDQINHEYMNDNDPYERGSQTWAINAQLLGLESEKMQYSVQVN